MLVDRLSTLNGINPGDNIYTVLACKNLLLNRFEFDTAYHGILLTVMGVLYVAVVVKIYLTHRASTLVHDYALELQLTISFAFNLLMLM